MSDITVQRVTALAQRLANVEERTDNLGARCENAHVRLLKLLPDHPVSDSTLLIFERIMSVLEHALGTSESTMTAFEQQLTNQGV